MSINASACAATVPKQETWLAFSHVLLMVRNRYRIPLAVAAIAGTIVLGYYVTWEAFAGEAPNDPLVSLPALSRTARKGDVLQPSAVAALARKGLTLTTIRHVAASAYLGTDSDGNVCFWYVGTRAEDVNGFCSPPDKFLTAGPLSFGLTRAAKDDAAMLRVIGIAQPDIAAVELVFATRRMSLEISSDHAFSENVDVARLGMPHAIEARDSGFRIVASYRLGSRRQLLDVVGPPLGDETTSP